MDRERIKELAQQAAGGRLSGNDPLLVRIEESILQALREAMGEPDDAMIAAGVETFGGIVGTPENLAKPEYVERMTNSQRKAVMSHWTAMAAVRLRGVGGG